MAGGYLRTRRRFLAAAGASVSALAGCAGGNESDTTTSTTVVTTTTQTTTQATTDTTETTTTEEETTKTTTTEEPLPEQGSINAVPADPDAEYADSEIFNILDGDVEYELELAEARERHYDNIEDESSRRPLLQEFVKHIDDEEWLKTNIIENYNNSGPDNRAQIEYKFDWGEYKKDAPLDQRIFDSNFMDLWYTVQFLALGGIDSGHDMEGAAVIQAIEDKAGKNTLTFAHKTVPTRHGLVSAIENPTYNPEEFSEQQTYVIETDDSRDPQVSVLGEEGYLTGNDTDHPAEVGAGIERLWLKMLGEHSEGDTFYAESLDSTEKSRKALSEFMLNPSTDSGQKFFDLAMTAYDIGFNEEFEGKNIKVGADRIVYHSS